MINEEARSLRVLRLRSEMESLRKKSLKAIFETFPDGEYTCDNVTIDGHRIKDIQVKDNDLTFRFCNPAGIPESPVTHSVNELSAQVCIGLLQYLKPRRNDV